MESDAEPSQSSGSRTRRGCSRRTVNQGLPSVRVVVVRETNLGLTVLTIEFCPEICISLNIVCDF